MRPTHGGLPVATHRVLVAFASEQGSTAAIAHDIARALRERGLEVDCLPATSVRDVTPYEGVILGSGVFLPRRGSDGQGFLPRHAAALRSRPVWLFAAGPLGGTAPPAGSALDAAEDDPESPLARVARSVGARGLAAFGSSMAEAVDTEHPPSAARDRERVRGWAETIAAAFRDPLETRQPH
jgi:menaquinone-dependent protoporphyrinogen oxidase